MGNRAVIALNNYGPDNMGIYLHWNGGRDSVEGFLEATKQIMGSRLGDKSYGTSRLIQVITTLFTGNLSVGVDLQKNLDCDNYDNGVYVVDTQTMEITGRHHHSVSEQTEYTAKEFASHIVKAIEASAESINS